jgi:hypothetical protein
MDGVLGTTRSTHEGDLFASNFKILKRGEYIMEGLSRIIGRAPSELGRADLLQRIQTERTRAASEVALFKRKKGQAKKPRSTNPTKQLADDLTEETGLSVAEIAALIRKVKEEKNKDE